MDSLNKLEKMVLEKLLQGTDSRLSVLREQLNQLTVMSRESIGVGSFTRFSVPPDLPRLEGAGTFKFGDVTGETPTLQHGMGFLLTVCDGVIVELEGYTYDEPWPEVLGEIKLAYADPNKRNVDELFLPT